jgi:hypothetical protein
MANQEFFLQRPQIHPTIYAYSLVGVASHTGYVKVGFTERDVETRINEQVHTVGVPFKIHLRESAMRTDGTCFTDHDVHTILRRRGFLQLNAGEDRNEWFKCSVNDVMAAIVALRTGSANVENRTQTFKMRPEQYHAVDKTVEYFKTAKKEEPNRIPKFLWNAKMRFGKTFASYQLARKMGLKRVLVLTFKPAVESAWREDLVSHVDFEGWQFVSNKDAHNNNVNMDQQFAMISPFSSPCFLMYFDIVSLMFGSESKDKQISKIFADFWIFCSFSNSIIVKLVLFSLGFTSIYLFSA